MNTTPIKDNSFEDIKTQKREAVETERYEEEKRRSWIQFWVPLVVSNIIAVSALVVSILAYIK